MCVKRTNLHVLQTCKTVVIKRKPIFGLSGKPPSEHLPLPDRCPVSFSRFGKLGTEHVCGVYIFFLFWIFYSTSHMLCSKVLKYSVQVDWQGQLCTSVCINTATAGKPVLLATCFKKRSVFLHGGTNWVQNVTPYTSESRGQSCWIQKRLNSS